MYTLGPTQPGPIPWYCCCIQITKTIVTLDSELSERSKTVSIQWSNWLNVNLLQSENWWKFQTQPTKNGTTVHLKNTDAPSMRGSTWRNLNWPKCDPGWKKTTDYQNLNQSPEVADSIHARTWSDDQTKRRLTWTLLRVPWRPLLQTSACPYASLCSSTWDWWLGPLPGERQVEGL